MRAHWDASAETVGNSRRYVRDSLRKPAAKTRYVGAGVFTHRRERCEARIAFIEEGYIGSRISFGGQLAILESHIALGHLSHVGLHGAEVRQPRLDESLQPLGRHVGNVDIEDNR